METNQKNNSYLPLSDIKILLASNDLYREMDVLFISASTFSKEIVNNAKEFFNPKNILNLFD